MNQEPPDREAATCGDVPHYSLFSSSLCEVNKKHSFFSSAQSNIAVYYLYDYYRSKATGTPYPSFMYPNRKSALI